MEENCKGWERLRAYQKEGALALASGEKVGLCVSTGLGKMQPLSARILTPYGWVSMGKLRLGDKVVDPDGGYGRVIAIYPNGEQEVFRVTMKDGGSTLCGDKHLWLVQNATGKCKGIEPKVVSTKKMRKKGVKTPPAKNGWARHKFFIPTCDVDFYPSQAPLPLKPYLLGVILGDASSEENSITLHTPDEYIVNRVIELLPSGTKLNKHKSKRAGACDAWGMARDGVGSATPNAVVAAFKLLGLAGKRSWEKHIPIIYLRTSKEERIELLRGLMDTDGDCSAGGAGKKTSCAIFNTSSEIMAYQVQELVRGLGGIASLSVKEEPKYAYKGEILTGRRAYRVTVRTPFNPFTLPKKADRYTEPGLARAIVSIEPEGTAVCQCITVTTKRNLYITDDHIVTHNTAKILAAWSKHPVGPVLVLTRAIGRHAWVRDAEWVLGESCAELWAGKIHGKSGVHKDGTFTSLEKALEGSRWVVANYDIVKARYEEFSAINWQYLILDESHEVKQGYAPPKRLESGGYKWRRYEYVKALAVQVQARGGVVWMLTATPVRDRVRDLWAQLSIVLPKDHPEKGKFGKWNWLHKFCGAKRNEWGGLDTTGSSNEEILGAYIQKHFVVLRRQDVADQMPALQREIRVVEPQWSKKGVRLGGGIEAAIDTAAVMKFDVACELALEYLSGGTKVILVVSRRKHATALGMLLAERCTKELHALVRRNLWAATVTGATEVRARMKVCGEFQAHQGPGVLVATMDCISTSMDLHTASGLIYVALPYTYLGVVQMEGRVGRLGGVPCTITYLIAKRTIDERIKSLLLSKLRAVENVGADTQGGEGTKGVLAGGSDAEVLKGLRDWLNK